MQNLAVAVVLQAVSDYRRLARVRERYVRRENSWMDRDAALNDIRLFFSSRGGAEIYLELAGSGIDPAVIRRKLSE